jgi:hypothetical protein
MSVFYCGGNFPLSQEFRRFFSEKVRFSLNIPGEFGIITIALKRAGI